MSNRTSLNAKQKRRKLAVLRARDGEDCWLCGKPMVFAELRMNQGLLATLDHVIPVHEGGGHATANLRLAHRSCNTIRRGTESNRTDPNGCDVHRFHFNGRRHKFTAYWLMFRRIDSEGILR